jgi:hypothetical protein
MDQVVQIIGALLVLVGFASAQFGWLTPTSRPYLLVNLAGAGILGYVAAADSQYGFLLLEVVWVLVSIWGLVRSSDETAATS